MWNIVIVVCIIAAIQTLGQATLSDEDRSFPLPESIYTTACDSPSLDRDLDGLKDSFENALADAWRPYFIYDQNENDRSSNIKDDSLLSWEPRVIFQVRPIGSWDWPRRIVIKWGFLYRLDGGFRESWICKDWHYGDTQSGSYELTSWDGKNWNLDSLRLWTDVPFTYANDPRIQWTAVRSTYWDEMPARPSPKIHASAGKHHQYMTAESCEGDHDCDDDCDGGAQRLADLTPLGYFTNVGEPDNHPSDESENSPFVTDLGPLGYPGEYVWYSSYKCQCSGAIAGQKDSRDCFTGGLGSNWKASTGVVSSCTIPSPVYSLFSHDPLTLNPDRGCVSCSKGGQVVSRGEEQLDVFWRGRDNHLKHIWYPYNGDWSWEQDLGGDLQSQPVAISWGEGRLDVFWRGSDDHLKHLWYPYNGDWSWEQDLGGDMASDPEVVSWGEGRLDVFWLGKDNHLKHIWYPYNDDWSWEQDLGGDLASYPVAISRGEEQLDVFWRGRDNHLKHIWYPYNDDWSWEQDLGGDLVSMPDAISWGEGRLDVFWRGSDDHLKHLWYPYGEDWSWEQDLGGDLSSSPKVISRGLGRLDVFWRGKDAHIKHLWFPYDEDWSWEQDLGGDLNPGPEEPELFDLRSEPMPISWGGDRLDIFWRGNNSHLKHLWYPYGEDWSWEQDLGGDLSPLH